MFIQKQEEGGYQLSVVYLLNMAEGNVDACKVSVSKGLDEELTTAEPVKQELQGGESEEELAKKKQQIQEALEKALLAVGLDSLVISQKSVEPCKHSEQEETLKGSDSVKVREEVAPIDNGRKKKGKKLPKLKSESKSDFKTINVNW